MLERKIEIRLPRGLQAQGATAFVRKAASFASKISIIKDGKLVAGKSIMGVMCLALRKGEEVTLIADGNDEQAAITDLENFLSLKK